MKLKTNNKNKIITYLSQIAYDIRSRKNNNMMMIIHGILLILLSTKKFIFLSKVTII